MEVRKINEEDGTLHILGSVTTENIHVISKDNTPNWQAMVKVIPKFCTKTINFRLDMGADVTIILDWYFKKNSPLIQPTNKILYGAGHHEMKVIGCVETMLAMETKLTTRPVC